MSIKIKDILNYLSNMELEYKYRGDDQLVINDFCALNNLRDSSITWIKNIDNFKGCNFTNIKDILVVSNEILKDEINNKNINFIFCNNPKEVFFSILKEFFKQKEYNKYISPNSVVETTSIGESVYIGHNCYIGSGVIIGDNVVIKNHISIEGRVKIGNNTTIHSGVVIGTDGFGYFQNSDGKNIKVPHYGGVVIGKDVEIGANTCIDRGTLEDTIIGNNVKIDNLCHIAHNVIIKDNCSVIALSMLGGSVILEKDSYIAPGAIIKNQLTIGENSLVGLGAVVIKDVEKNKVVAGVPAKIIKEI
ncbi:UDP-3-O-(3-hydroxymyristoyl)glucosamine N-acyltransferase [Lutispora sp.]|uniref:UDP-3-O-(3-hydroxymyristoyl)glucosamine N-acyltransferase n=1 Tax=Lutispora sp. TaxID=2828727 RepID=UPI002B2021CD|nr:UDP-3-O-(3-hydroxymyristoyl)glucosamine N-acyltransferase [Lutispora sp.]MEA4964002.1 UDP-3-O-(3-hydroxymyristoyl)glucosamine N-acyltransferase [Lutispora sp.]